MNKVLSALFLFLMLSSVNSFAAPVRSAPANDSDVSMAGRHAVGFGIGQSLLMGDLPSNFSNAFAYSLTYDYEVSDVFGIFVNGLYERHDGSGPTAPFNSLNMMGVTPNLKVNFAYIDRLVFYGITGFGLYRVEEKIVSREATLSTFGFNLGGGFDLILADHIKFGMLINLFNLFNKTESGSGNTSGPPLTVGGTFAHLMLTAGFVF